MKEEEEELEEEEAGLLPGSLTCDSPLQLDSTS